MEGQTLSHYRVLEKIGGGGMGVVYKALDTHLDRHVALKLLPPELTRDIDARERFVLEAKAASALDHPNICTIYDIDEAPDGQMFIAMAYYEGETLKQRVEDGPLPVEQALDIAIQVAQGLEKAHESGIVHRDIKPANLMLTRDGLVKIVDFGIAKLLGVTGPTQTGTTLGTVAYMSPEQIAGENADGQSDVWALGAVLFELLTGHPAFKGESQWAVMNAISNRDPGPPSAVRADIPPEADAVVKRALERDKNQRYQSAAEFLTTARRCHADLTQPIPVAAASVGPFQGLTPKLAIGALVVVVAGGIATFWSSNSGADVRWAREEAIPEIMRLIEDSDYVSAFDLAEQAQAHIPGDPVLEELWPQMAAVASLHVEPPQTDVYYRPYGDGDGEWRYLGPTPVEDVRLPRGVFQLRLEKESFESRLLATTNRGPLFENMGAVGRAPEPLGVELSPAGEDRMVQVPAGAFYIPLAGMTLENVPIGPYKIGRYEVTNVEYQEFVDQSGYSTPDYWRHLTFLKDGEALSWELAVADFVDSTGQPGPSTWELGEYPAGEGTHPVRGLSWFEASAYARFRGMHLPTASHWARAALSPRELISPLNGVIAPVSNFSGEGPAPVGTYQGVGPYGTFDMAGNVREWGANQVRDQREQRVMLGGSWADPQYMFTLANNLPAFDRAASNGLRLVEYPGGEEPSGDLAGPFSVSTGDLADAEVVSDEVFDVFVRQAAYADVANDPLIEATDDSSEYWIRQTLSLDASSGQRITAYLFLPKQSEPPYQLVVRFGGAGPFLAQFSSERQGAPDFLLRDGRAVVSPVYEGSYERWDGQGLELTRERTMAWREDLGRTLDYLETRDDIDMDSVAYYGTSYGAFAGLPLLALEERLQVAVLTSGGLLHALSAPPEAHPVNYVPRTTIPVLMVNGRYDYIFPVDTAQDGLFERLGTAPEHKHRVILDAGHAPLPRGRLIAETLAWLDKYLGPVD